MAIESSKVQKFKKCTFYCYKCYKKVSKEYSLLSKNLALVVHNKFPKKKKEKNEKSNFLD